MTDNSMPIRLICSISLGFGLLLMTAPPVVAQGQDNPQATEDRAAREAVTREDILAAIKRRAERILEQRLAREREARRLQTYLQISNVIAYESNPANAGNRKGDTYHEVNSYGQVSKPLAPTINWTSSYYGSYTHYLDYGDGDYTSHTLTPIKLAWQPGRMWRIEGWNDLDYSYYPTANDSSYRQLKFSGRIRQNLFETWFHQFQYEWYVRDYTRKNARDGGGNETLSNRVDQRHKIRHTVGTTIKEALPLLKNALASVETSFHWNDSNDARGDHFDEQVWKLTSSLNGSLTPRWSLNGSFAFERKNYDARTIADATAEARYDDKYTLSSTLTYKVADQWDMACGLNYDNLTSNERTGPFDNMKYSMTVTKRF